MHKTVLIQGPQVEPIGLEEAKAHLNITSSRHDAYIASLISASRRQLERYLNRVMITQKWKVYYDCWNGELLIPFGNLQIVENESVVVKYYDISGAQKTLTEQYFWVVNSLDPARIVRKYDAVYPELQYGRPDAIEIAFTAGYGDDASAIPDDLRHAMKLMIADYFDQRGEVVVGMQANKIRGFIKDLVHSYKLYSF